MFKYEVVFEKVCVYFYSGKKICYVFFEGFGWKYFVKDLKNDF